MTDQGFPRAGKRIFGGVRLLAAALVLFALWAAPSAGEEEPERILVLHSYHAGYPWTDGIMAGMQQVFQESRRHIDVQVEYLDARRYRDTEYFAHILDAILNYKLADRAFDLALVSDNDALDFAVKHRHDLLAGTPIVFCGINLAADQADFGIDIATGVIERPAYLETLGLIRRLLPKARRLVVIGGHRSVTDRANRSRVEAAIDGKSREDWAVEFWDDLSLEQAVEQARSLPPETVLLINGSLVDHGGHLSNPAEAAQELRAVSPAPIFSFWDYTLGKGIVGGRLLSSRLQGEEAARLALRILGGERAGSIPPVTRDTHRRQFDERELKRLGISRSRLPEGSEVLFTPPPFYELSKDQLWVLLGVMAVLTGGLLINILGKRKAERSRRESESRVRLLLSSTAEAIYGLDRQGRCTFCNPAGLHLFGFQSESQALGRSMHELNHHSRQDGTPYPEEECPICQAWLRGERVHLPEEVFWRVDGEAVPVEAWAYPIREGGRLVGAVVTCLDITERRQAAEGLRRSLRELDAFVYTVSHDLRIPLTPIIGYAELLAQQYRDRLDDPALQMLGEIRRQAERMAQQMEDLLVLARLGRLPAPAAAVDADRLLSEILCELCEAIATSGLAVEARPLPSVRVPETLLYQALLNLVGNALRYAGPGGGPIEVGGERRGERVLFFVRDHGPGVTPAEAERIFEVFQRGEAGQKVPGTGVGLAIVAKVARLCGGRAWVEPTPAGGSTFWLEVMEPEASVGAETPPAPRTPV